MFLSFWHFLLNYQKSVVQINPIVLFSWQTHEMYHTKISGVVMNISNICFSVVCSRAGYYFYNKVNHDHSSFACLLINLQENMVTAKGLNLLKGFVHWNSFPNLFTYYLRVYVCVRMCLRSLIKWNICCIYFFGRFKNTIINIPSSF